MNWNWISWATARLRCFVLCPIQIRRSCAQIGHFGGQKQRVAIARALSNDPLLILADDPTGNLDSKSSNAVIEAFLFAKEQLGATVLMVTHDAIAASHADRVIALSDGVVVRELVRQKEQRQFMNDILEFLKIVEVGQ